MKTTRRNFIRNTTIASLAATLPFDKNFLQQKNRLPKWKGFNLLDFFSPTPPRNQSSGKTTAEDLKWMQDWGFNFVRIPMAYPRYLSFDRSRNITKDEIYKFDTTVLEEIDLLVNTAISYDMHVSLNLH